MSWKRFLGKRFFQTKWDIYAPVDDQMVRIYKTPVGEEGVRTSPPTDCELWDTDIRQNYKLACPTVAN